MNAKMLVLMTTIVMGGCATAPAPVDIHGGVPPQKMVKGASAVLIKRHIKFTPNGPVQACDYTVTLTEVFTVYSDICLAYIPIPKEVIADIEAHPGQKPTNITTEATILPYNTWNTGNETFTKDDLPTEDPEPKQVATYGAPISEPLFKKEW